MRTGFINAGRNRKIAHLFEDLCVGKKTLRERTLQKREKHLTLFGKIVSLFEKIGWR
jgi:hypothetical protein